MELGRSPCFFFFNDTATTEIYTLSLHDALPIWDGSEAPSKKSAVRRGVTACLIPHHRNSPVPQSGGFGVRARGDRKSTRLNSSHVRISYAVFCLKKKHNPSGHH